MRELTQIELIEINGGSKARAIGRFLGFLFRRGLHDATDFARGFYDEL